MSVGHLYKFQTSCEREGSQVAFFRRIFALLFSFLGTSEKFGVLNFAQILCK